MSNEDIRDRIDTTADARRRDPGCRRAEDRAQGFVARTSGKLARIKVEEALAESQNNAYKYGKQVHAAFSGRALTGLQILNLPLPAPNRLQLAVHDRLLTRDLIIIFVTDCVERALPAHLARHPTDQRFRRSIDVARGFIRGEVRPRVLRGALRHLRDAGIRWRDSSGRVAVVYADLLRTLVETDEAKQLDRASFDAHAIWALDSALDACVPQRTYAELHAAAGRPWAEDPVIVAETEWWVDRLRQIFREER